MIHFLHIGKTGGTAVREALQPLAGERGLVFHKHQIRLADIPADEPVVLFVRHPVSRFVSSFNSRLRRGAPRYNGKWNAAEEIAFARFVTPGLLADALGDADPERRRAAEAAMAGINHVRQPLTYWIERVEQVRARTAPTFIGRQERLAADFARLKTELSLPAGLALPSDPIAAHVTPAGMNNALNPAGQARIEHWYAADIALHAQLAREDGGP